MFLSDRFNLKKYQERAFKFTAENNKTLLALPTGSGKSLVSTYSIYKILPKNFRVFFFTETVAVDDIINDCMLNFFSKGTFKPVSTIGCNFSVRENLYNDLVNGDINSIVTTYAIMRNDAEYIRTLIKYFKNNNIPVAIVLDEATQVKTETSKNHIVAKELGQYADLMIALTATPITSKLNDIDNIIRCLNPKKYISKERFKARYEINTFETDGFLFKLKGSSIYINSNEDALPNKVLKNGKAYFKIPWKLDANMVPTGVILRTKRPTNILVNSLPIYLPSMLDKSSEYIDDITPFLMYDSTVNKFTIYTPITKSLRESVVRYRSIKFTVKYFNKKTKTEVLIDYLYSFSYDIGQNLIGYKNLTEYKEVTGNVLFTLNKNEVGEIPPYVLFKRRYDNDKYTKKAVQNVYETAKGGVTSVARIMIASSAPSYILEDKLTINNKAKLLLDDLQSELNNEPIIIYSSLVSVIKYLSDVLTSKCIDHCVYHGQLSNDEKTVNKNLFKTGKTKILIASSAAAKGVNLQIGKTIIFYDLPYTAEIFQQVSGRIGRLGSVHKTLNIISYLTHTEDAIENCLYRNIMGQMNFIKKVDINLVDTNLIDKSVSDLIDPEDSDKYIMTRLGHGRSYYYSK